MNTIVLWGIATVWALLSIGFGLFVCPRLFRNAPGGVE